MEKGSQKMQAYLSEISCHYHTADRFSFFFLKWRNRVIDKNVLGFFFGGTVAAGLPDTDQPS
jgi:hypothetical protein